MGCGQSHQKEEMSDAEKERKEYERSIKTRAKGKKVFPRSNEGFNDYEK